VGGNRFADNPAYLFLHMSSSNRLRCVWVTGTQETVDRLRAAGYDAVRRWTVEGVWVALRASWYVFSSSRADINVWFSDGATALNLWHGVGVKRVQRDRVVGQGAAIHTAGEGTFTARVLADERRPPDWMLSTSPMMTKIFARSFGILEERCIELGYPRNDHLITGGEAPELLVDESINEALRGAVPVVGYFPTFRDTTVSVPGGVPLIREMSEIVAAQGGSLFFKSHTSTWIPGLSEAGAVVLPKEADLNAYLAKCDVLVTDYSSAASDFLFLNKPVVLFFPDFDEFNDERGFNFEPLLMMPGIVTRSKEELYKVLQNVGSITLPEKTSRLLDAYWAPHARAGASERIACFIEDRLKRSENPRRRTASFC